MTHLDVSGLDLNVLESMTKYPSIPTYHRQLPNGALDEESLRDQFEGRVVVTEKIDGANGRIIFMPDGGYIIGSREEFLHASGDLIRNPRLGIVEALRPIAQANVHLAEREGDGTLLVCYFEVYGGAKITPASRNYTTTQQLGVRLFDVAEVTAHEYRQLFALPVDQVASWRDSGGQYFQDEIELFAMAQTLNVAPAPRLDTVDAADLPTSIDAMHEWLQKLLPHTYAGLEEGLRGSPEGVVLRDWHRHSIAKVRFQNYRRTAQVRAGAR